MRRRGLHPGLGRAAVRRLVDEVVSEYDERTLTSVLPPPADRGQAVYTVLDTVAKRTAAAPPRRPKSRDTP